MRVALASSLLVLVVAGASVACGSKEPPPVSSPAETVPVASPASPASAAPADTVSPLAKKPLEVFNGCADVVTVVFGEDPKAQNASKRTLAQNASITDAPRNNDGTQTVFLLDQSGTPLVKASVTRHMKRVEIGRSCRTIDAR